MDRLDPLGVDGTKRMSDGLETECDDFKHSA